MFGRPGNASASHQGTSGAVPEVVLIAIYHLYWLAVGKAHL